MEIDCKADEAVNFEGSQWILTWAAVYMSWTRRAGIGGEFYQSNSPATAPATVTRWGLAESPTAVRIFSTTSGSPIKAIAAGSFQAEEGRDGGAVLRQGGGSDDPI